MEGIETIIPKMLEYGALGVINILLIFRGIPAMNELSKAISRLADKLDQIDGRVNILERDVHECLHDVKVALEDLIRRIDERRDKV